MVTSRPRSQPEEDVVGERDGQGDEHAKYDPASGTEMLGQPGAKFSKRISLGSEQLLLFPCP
jgi:hypothetical protein